MNLLNLLLMKAMEAFLSASSLCFPYMISTMLYFEFSLLIGDISLISISWKKYRIKDGTEEVITELNYTFLQWYEKIITTFWWLHSVDFTLLFLREYLKKRFACMAALWVWIIFSQSVGTCVVTIYSSL